MCGAWLRTTVESAEEPSAVASEERGTQPPMKPAEATS